MKSAAINKLVALIVDSMSDGHLDLAGIRQALYEELHARLNDVRRHSEDYTQEELDYWHGIEHDVELLKRTTPPRLLPEEGA